MVRSVERKREEIVLRNKNLNIMVVWEAVKIGSCYVHRMEEKGGRPQGTKKGAGS